jgi:hypothetical protein
MQLQEQEAPMVLLASSYDESRFFKAADLKNDIRLKIKDVTEEKMADGEVKLVVWFTSDKRGLVLNRTNNRTIRTAFGDAVDGWSGKIIVLFPIAAEFRGKMGPALRVRIPPPKGDGYRVAPTPVKKPQSKPPADEDDDFDEAELLDDDISDAG